MKKVVFNVMLVTAAAKLLGFVRELALSYFLGATGISDAYLISLTIPGTVFQFVGTGLATCFIPVFLRIAGEEERNIFTNTVLTAILFFSTAAIALVWGSGDAIVRIFASGFTGETLEYAVLFTRINITSLYFSGFIYVFCSFLQAEECFLPAAFAAIPNSLLVILSVILGAKVHILWLPFGSVAAVFLQLVVLLPAVRKFHFRLRLNLRFRSARMRELYGLILPVIVGVSVNEINVLVDKTIASRVAEGGISALSYAYSLVMFVQGIFAQTVASVYYPTIAGLAERGEKEGLQAVVREAADGMLYLLLPVMFGCMLLAEQAVELLYGRGAFLAPAVRMTAAALTGYAVGTAAYGLREVFSRVFYAVHDTRTPTRNAMIGMAVNILLNLLFGRIWGIGGLAFATSLSAAATSLLLLRDLRRKRIYRVDGHSARMLAKMLFSALLMSAAVIFVQRMMPQTGGYAGFVFSIIAGAVVYIGCTWLLKVDVIRTFVGAVCASRGGR